MPMKSRVSEKEERPLRHRSLFSDFSGHVWMRTRLHRSILILFFVRRRFAWVSPGVVRCLIFFGLDLIELHRNLPAEFLILTHQGSYDVFHGDRLILVFGEDSRR